MKPKLKSLQNFMQKLDEKRHDATTTRRAVHNSVLEEVEQEREVEFQVEEQREVQKPDHFKAAKFGGIHPAIRTFATTGILPAIDEGEGYVHIFAALATTLIGQKFAVRGTESSLFVSDEVMTTVDFGAKGRNDNFLVSRSFFCTVGYVHHVSQSKCYIANVLC